MSHRPKIHLSLPPFLLSLSLSASLPAASLLPRLSGVVDGVVKEPCHERPSVLDVPLLEPYLVTHILQLQELYTSHGNTQIE